MGGYTKGPWRLIDNGPHWNNPNITNYKIAWSDAGELVCEHVYEQADARLIAASPAMAEYLSELADAGDKRAAEILEAINAPR